MAAIPPAKIEEQHKKDSSSKPRPASFSAAVLQVNDQRIIGSLCFKSELPYLIGVTVHRGRFNLGFFRKTSESGSYRWSCIAYRPGETVPTTVSGPGENLSELKIQAFRYEVVDESGYLEDDTRMALRTNRDRVDTDVLVQITVLCTRHGLPEAMMGPQWKSLDAALWRNLEEMTNDNYVLTIWCLMDPLSKRIQTLANFESAVEHCVRQATHSSRQDTVPGAFEHLTFRTPLADYMRSAGSVEGRDSRSVSSRANYPSVEATAATGQSSSDAELQAKMQKLEEENQQLRLAVQRSNAAVEQMGKDLQRLKDTAYKNSKNLRQNVINFTERQEEEIKQLRGVGRFWMGMERLRHEKITQFFDGNLPEDDIVFQLAEKGPPES